MMNTKKKAQFILCMLCLFLDALLHIEPNWSPLFTGEKVTFICDLKEGNNADWVYSFTWHDHWLTNSRPENRFTSSSLTTGYSGEYQCFASQKSSYVRRESNKVSLSVSVTNRAVVTLQHDLPEIYSGETITLTCGIEEGGGSEWEYEWRTPDYYTPPNPRGSMMTSSVRGDYSCKGRLKDGGSTTEWSDAFTVKTSGVPQPVLTVSPSWTSPGDSVTLTCSVEPPSAGWRFFWYQAVPELSPNYTYELLAGNTTGTEQDSYILHGQTHTAGYVCRAGRGDPVFYTLYSDVKIRINVLFVLTYPHRLQHFSTESLSLSCEGNSAEWRVMKADESGFMSSCSHWGQMTGSTCNTDTRASSGVYWCESATQSSNAANITTHSGDVILVSPVHPVTEGHSVTLGCTLRTKDLLHNVDFYKNDKLLPNGVGGELFISAVTKSDEGFYKCRGRNSPPGLETLTSAESWLSVEREYDSVFLLLLVVGLVSGVLLIILLLLILCCYRKSKGEIFSF
uniref:Ig-like domain-containing protein n=1 Tax=Gasterosteus aculeatus aculeatus TaxID=481459 RepID=A0AAQ4PPA2_GASAC